MIFVRIFAATSLTWHQNRVHLSVVENNDDGSNNTGFGQLGQ